MTMDEAKRLLQLTMQIGKLSRELDKVMEERKVRDDFWTGYHQGMSYAAQILAGEITEMIQEGEV